MDIHIDLEVKKIKVIFLRKTTMNFRKFKIKLQLNLIAHN